MKFKISYIKAKEEGEREKIINKEEEREREKFIFIWLKHFFF